MSELQLLFDNKISAITIDGFISIGQINTFLNVLYKQPEWKEAAIPEAQEHLFVNKPKPKHLFLSQYMVSAFNTTEDEYLALSKNYLDVWGKMTNTCGFNPYLLFTNYLKNAFQADVQLARKANAAYCPVVVRDLSEVVLPHADYGPYDGKGWAIEQVTKQIAWNLYLTDPGEGGETVVFDYVWDNELDMDENSYGIENLDKPVKTQFFVKPARLVLFNCRNFHTVLKSSSPRIAIGGLLGQTTNGEYLAWA